MLRLLAQTVPRKDHVITVHDQIFLLARRERDLLLRRLHGRAVKCALVGPELPLDDFLQLPLVQIDILRPHANGRRRVLLCLPQDAFQVHIGGNRVPFDIHACAVGAEHGIRRIVQVRLRVIVCLLDYLLRIVAGRVALDLADKLALSARIGNNLGHVGLHFGHGRAALQKGHVALLQGSAKGAAHRAQVVDRASELRSGYRQTEAVKRL